MREGEVKKQMQRDNVEIKSGESRARKWYEKIERMQSEKVERKSAIRKQRENVQ